MYSDVQKSMQPFQSKTKKIESYNNIVKYFGTLKQREIYGKVTLREMDSLSTNMPVHDTPEDLSHGVIIKLIDGNSIHVTQETWCD